MQQQQQTEIAASLALQAGSDVLLELTRAEVVTWGLSAPTLWGRSVVGPRSTVLSSSIKPSINNTAAAHQHCGVAAVTHTHHISCVYKLKPNIGTRAYEYPGSTTGLFIIYYY